MQRERGMIFNQSQQRALFFALKRVDELLSAAIAAGGSKKPITLFPDVLADATPERQKSLRLCLEQLRAIILRFIGTNGIPILPPKAGAHWALRVALNFASVELEQLEPKRFRAFGELSGEAEDVLTKLLNDLRSVLEKIAAVPEPSLDEATEGRGTGGIDEPSG